jgi:hypothetical protein
MDVVFVPTVIHDDLRIIKFEFLSLVADHQSRAAEEPDIIIEHLKIFGLAANEVNTLSARIPCKGM